ncbi:hypothetical protein COSHB9_15110 [Companilactobacillus alimentarius]|uniref:Uncharacterized protein n=1 Tax=Companilactobacillus alimentarius DSM 20249 TaxID=1423720 RepID=A0A2K9HJF4_9LACO|nr:hypothetical protein [Companilactobacillus alimentarius]AUI72670.1 hypothetical protein LA20249_10935 [Companilactobacillus alimentarius DSM 20249]KRK75641.1 hypothetical protein FC67_GL001138 [Companilactobacillus alimentarius DSM 20249]MDT6952169.1 hypothetical protein [Companilactobacillus alimentarius]GEO45405.1 hypothetical protein LAL01_16370 [Companilactobacillus alimentarius]
MFTYIQILDSNSHLFSGYADYRFHKGLLSLTISHGAEPAHHIEIAINQITDLLIDDFYGYERISFVYKGKKIFIINSGYGESNYFKNHIIQAVNI